METRDCNCVWWRMCFTGKEPANGGRGGGNALGRKYMKSYTALKETAYHHFTLIRDEQKT